MDQKTENKTELEKLMQAAAEGLKRSFGGEATAHGVAPGRVEVIGNHTDYNEGYILSAAIDRYIVIAGRKLATGACNCAVQSAAYEEKQHAPVQFEYGKDLQKRSGTEEWANYVLGVVDEFQKRNVKLEGFEAYVVTNVPMGSGVSSSAALEMATAKLLLQLFPEACKTFSDLDVVLMCKSAENNFVGMGCGVLDQFSSGMGKAGHLVYLDCRDLNKFEHVPFGEKAAFVLANTHAPHQLVDGQYMKLRANCEEAAALFDKKLDTKVTHLRDVSVKNFEDNQEMLPVDVRACAKHIVYENQRVLDSMQALKDGDLQKLGECMTASHNSSSNDFKNSCPQLDIMVKAAEGLDGWFGGRLMGGGFGGCTINLVEVTKVETFAKELSERYEKETGIKPSIVVVQAGDGAYSASA